MDREKFCCLIIRYKNNLFRAAHCILRNDADAEDAVCEAIAKAYAKRKTLRQEDAFRAWMLRIVINESYTIVRRRKEFVGLEYAEERASPGESEEMGLMYYVRQLGEEMRLPVLLFYYEDIRIRDIAVMLRLPENTVKSRLRRAKEKLRDMMTTEVEAYGF